MINNQTVGRLQLEEIINRYIPGVTTAIAMRHMEACMVCFDHNQHIPGVGMIVFAAGNKTTVNWDWSGTVNNHVKRAWKDLQEATEAGATAIAILLVINFTEFNVVERSAKGPGFDYWLAEDENYDEDDIFPANGARLEVTGMIKAKNDSEIRSRVNKKKKQTDKSDNLNLPAIVVVVEFARPEAHLVRKI